MTVFSYAVLTCAHEGREDEYLAWYRDQHLADVAAVSGVISAKLFPVVSVEAQGIDAPGWRGLAIYEIETDGDPADVLARIRERAGTDAMPLTEALDPDGLVQIVAFNRESP